MRQVIIGAGLGLVLATWASFPLQASEDGCPGIHSDPVVVSEAQARAEDGDPQSQHCMGLHDLGQWVRNGQGLGNMLGEETVVPHPLLVSSKAWFGRAAVQGHADAQYHYARFFVNDDITEAAHWYEKAASQGHADAQSAIGNLYSSGWGVELDIPRGVAWVLLSIENGSSVTDNPEFKQEFEQLWTVLTPNQQAEAERIYQELLPKTPGRPGLRP